MCGTVYNRAVQEAARSAAPHLLFRDMKPEELRVLEVFVQGVMCLQYYLLVTGKVCVADALLLCSISL